MKKGLNKGQTAVLILMLSIIAFQGIYLFRTSKETSSLQESSAASGEIQKNQKIVREITQFKLGDFPFLPKRVDPEKKLIAFSFDDGPSRKNTVKDPLILWSIDTLDWKTLNADKTADAILKQAKDGDIILMHDIHAPTAEAVKKVLPKLEKKGFQVCTVSELLEARNITLHPGDVVVSANDVYRYKK